jgi:Tfp pilus assembly pilus retraction ATPase PilT
MIYTLPLERISGTINQYSLGRPNPFATTSSTERKTILLVGATGSGKTTWINSMVNYVLGVKWDDPFRFMLPDE